VKGPTERNRQELDSGEGRESQTRKRVREGGKEGHLSEEVQPSTIHESEMIRRLHQKGKQIRNCSVPTPSELEPDPKRVVTTDGQTASKQSFQIRSGCLLGGDQQE
jgi:hypothetical protein